MIFFFIELFLECKNIFLSWQNNIEHLRDRQNRLSSIDDTETNTVHDIYLMIIVQIQCCTKRCFLPRQRMYTTTNIIGTERKSSFSWVFVFENVSWYFVLQVALIVTVVTRICRCGKNRWKHCLTIRLSSSRNILAVRV